MNINHERKEILTNLGSDAYVLFQFYIEHLTEHQEMARDIMVAEHLGWNKCKAKRYRDRLTNNDNHIDYYKKVITDYYPSST